MVKLQKLVLRNFKSFKKADIPLSNGFTAIVGSNGSGKTNILDALLFVLGTSSMKMLRVSRIDELVNNNAVENYAKVELSIKEGDKTYLVQRMIDKKGKSVFRLDGKRKTRNEIVSLLLELGIKPDGHNIVVQGDTTRVIEMSPIERRQIIDELAGLQEFDAKKDEALKELQKVDNKLRDAGIVLQERENYLEQMRKDKDSAAEFESLQDENRKIKATIIFSEIEKLEKSEKECSEKLEVLEAEKKELESKTDKDSLEKKKLKDESERLNKLILSQRKETYATVGAQLEEARTGKALAAERLENKNRLFERNKTTVEVLEKKTLIIEEEAVIQKKRVSEINAELEVLGKKIKETAEKKNLLQSDAEQKERKLTEMNAVMERTTSELASLNEELFEKKVLLNGIKQKTEFKKQVMRETIQAIESAEAKVLEREKKAGLLAQLRKKFGNISETLAKTQREGERALEVLKETEAEKKGVVESIEMLGKNFAQCPVCDSQLEKRKSENLKVKKEGLLKKILIKEQTLKQRRKDLDSRLALLRESSEKEKALAVETADLKELREDFTKKREKLALLKQWLIENDYSDLLKKIGIGEGKESEKRTGLLAQKEKIKAFSEGVGLSTFTVVSDKLSEFEKQEHSLKQEKENLQNRFSEQLQKQKKVLLNEIVELKEENEKISSEIGFGEKELLALVEKTSALEAKVSESERHGQKMVEEKEKADRGIAKFESVIGKIHTRLKSIVQQVNTLLIEKSKREVRAADLNEETKEFKGVETIPDFEPAKLNQRLEAIEKRVKELGAINMKALESYNQLEAEVKDVRKKVEKLDEEKIAVIEMIERIDVKRTSVFMKCFDELSKNFSKMFNTLFNGEGALELSNRENPLEAGLLIQAKHKGDNIKNIDSMSGGEKTMTALAFLFAIQIYEPAPFYVFDEADSALDKENSVKMATIIKKISHQSQFIAITHNDPLVQEANQIIGVAVNKQKSSVIGLKLRDKLKAD